MELVGNKAKGRISKRVFQENKARQIFRKTSISYPLIRTRRAIRIVNTIFENVLMELVSELNWIESLYLKLAT